MYYSYLYVDLPSAKLDLFLIIFVFATRLSSKRTTTTKGGRIRREERRKRKQRRGEKGRKSGNCKKEIRKDSLQGT